MSARKGPDGDGDRPIDELLAEPVFNEAYSLLSKVLRVRTDDSIEYLEIVEVEPFTHLERTHHIDDFDSKERNKGELLLSFPRGNPQFHMVVDPETRAIVWIKKLKRDGETIGIAKLLSEYFGLDRGSFDSAQEFAAAVRARFDQMQILDNPRGILRVKEADQHRELHKIKRSTRKKAKNSLGALLKV